MSSTKQDMMEGSHWSQQILSQYEQGASDAEVAASLRVPIRQFHKQMQDSKAFADLIEFGRTLSQAFWEAAARKNISNKSFNSPLFAFYMKNKFGWADKTDVNTTSENTNVNIDSLREDLRKMVTKYIEQNTPELTDAQRVLKGLALQ